jgi:hypothetical protein
MNPLATALLNLLGTIPDAAVAIVHPEDYHEHLRLVLGEVFVRATNQATIMSGCAGHFYRGNDAITALYLLRSVQRGEVRVGTVALLKELRR